jgi:hypothetical protein
VTQIYGGDLFLRGFTTSAASSPTMQEGHHLR